MTKKVEISKSEKIAAQKNHKFNQGSVFSVLLRVAVPIIILMIFNSAYAFIDSLMSAAYVQYGLGPTGAVLNGGTSIGLIFPLMGILVGLLVMIAVGSGLSYTEAISQGNQIEAQNRKDQSIILMLIVGVVVFLIIAVIGIPYILTVSGNWGAVSNDPNTPWGEHTKEMVLDSYSYMLILGISFIPMQLTQMYVRILRSEGKGDAAALIPILTFPINIALDYILMSDTVGIQIGLSGAGIATLLANVVGLIMIMAYVQFKGNKNELKLKLKIPKFTIHKELTMIILTFAMGSFLRRLMDGGTVMVLTSYIGNINIGTTPTHVTDWQLSWTVMTRSVNMGTMIALGIAQGVSMLVAFYRGSNQWHKMKDTLIYGSIGMMISSILTALFLFGMQGILFNAYGLGLVWSRGNEISIAFTLMLIYSIPTAMQPLAVMYYAGTKQVKKTFIHTVSFNAIVLIFVTIAFILNQFYGNPLIIFVAMIIGALVGLSVVMTRFINTYKKQSIIHI